MLQLVENIKTKCKKKSTKLWNKFLKRQKQFFSFSSWHSFMILFWLNAISVSIFDFLHELKEINQFKIYLFFLNFLILKFRNPMKHRYILWWAFIQVQRSLLLQFIEYVKYADNHFSVVSAKVLNNIDTLIGFFTEHITISVLFYYFDAYFSRQLLLIFGLCEF